MKPLRQNIRQSILATPKKRKMPTYAYGITTVPDRRETHFPRTLRSLKEAGFINPRLFVDGDSDTDSWRSEFGLEVTSHYPHIRTFGNWMLGLAELYIRNPHADRYCIFQDDFITYKNLKSYLDSCDIPQNGYWNLYTFPKNEAKAPPNYMGWYLSNQRGLGAVALIFSRDTVSALLTAQHTVDRPKDLLRGWRAVDGAVVTALAKEGIREYVHTPSLVQHIGKQSSMRNREHPLATSFRGENFDASELIGVDNHASVT